MLYYLKLALLSSLSPHRTKKNASVIKKGISTTLECLQMQPNNSFFKNFRVQILKALRINRNAFVRSHNPSNQTTS